MITRYHMSAVLPAVAIYLLLATAMVVLAFRTEGALKFITSQRRVFTQQQLFLVRLMAIAGILCFCVMAAWVWHKFVGH